MGEKLRKKMIRASNNNDAQFHSLRNILDVLEWMLQASKPANQSGMILVRINEHDIKR